MTSIAEGTAAFLDAIDSGCHVLSRLNTRDADAGTADLAIELSIDDTVAGPAGALHGGLLATMVDYVGGRLASAGLDTGELVATSAMTIHFLAPVKTSAFAAGTVVKR